MKNITLSKTGRILEISAAVGFIIIGILARLFPHAPNFTPIAAMGLFGAVYFNKRYAISVPLAAMLISDFLIGFYEWQLMAAVYGSFLLITIIGFWVRNNKSSYKVIAAAPLSSVVFFLITNFAVWAFTPWYAKTFTGLMQTFLLAIPFFKNTLLGDLFYVSLFFGSYEVITALIRKKFSIIAGASIHTIEAA